MWDTMTDEHAEEGKESEGLHHGLTGVSWLDRALGVTEGVLGSPVGEGAEHALHHSAPMLMPGLGAGVGVFGVLAGGAETAMGTYEAVNGETPMARADGATSALQGVAGMTGGASSIYGAAAATGVIDSAATGAIGTGFMGSGMTALGAAGPLAAAGAVGLGTGSLIAHHMAGNTVDGFFGKDDTGRDRDASDWGTDVGLQVENGFQALNGVEEGGSGFFNTIGDKAGGLLGGIVGVTAGTGATLVGLGAEGLQAAGRGIANTAADVKGSAQSLGGMLDYDLHNMYAL